MGKEIKAEFKVTTPMFMSGHNQKKAEFRIPSVLGVLRFWYRATAPADLLYNLSELREAEAKLFGSINTGQASFLVRADQNGITTTTNNKPEWRNRPGIGYLGYGPITYKREERGNLVRNYIQEASFISLTFIFRPQLSNPDIEGLQRAIKALSLFGGLGSRSRRGFGSVTLLRLKDQDGNDLWRAPRNREELQTQISDFVGTLALRDKTKEPPYTAFSSESRIIISKTKMDVFNLLDEIGREMIRYRSYGSSRNGGRHNLPWGEEAKKYFASDHDLLLSLNQNSKLVTHPQRVAFGLPHNYFFRSTEQKIDITGKISDRRASPLFIHIHQLEREYTSVLTYLPAQFLPNNDSIKIQVKGQKPIAVPCNINNNNTITDFLNRIPDAMEVL